MERFISYPFVSSYTNPHIHPHLLTHKYIVLDLQIFVQEEQRKGDSGYNYVAYTFVHGLISCNVMIWLRDITAPNSHQAVKKKWMSSNKVHCCIGFSVI